MTRRGPAAHGRAHAAMSADEEAIAHLHDLAIGFGLLRARRMFGGHGVYHDGLMIALVEEGALYLKADAQTCERFAAAGGAPFVYTRQRKPVTLSFWSVPEAALDSPQDLRPWLRLAYEAALRKAQATPARPAQPRAKAGAARAGAKAGADSAAKTAAGAAATTPAKAASAKAARKPRAAAVKRRREV